MFQIISAIYQILPEMVECFFDDLQSISVRLFNCYEYYIFLFYNDILPHLSFIS